jgi:SAM-dependent methyltransferase
MKMMLTSFKVAAELPRKLHYKLFQAPKGYGEPVSAELLDQQYREGFWNFLEDLGEMPNKMVTAGYVHHLAKNLSRPPRLLDIGCGDGNLLEMLRHFPYESYLGLDVSAEAVKQGKARNVPRAEFEVSDFTVQPPAGKFDFIISTGSICYATDPVAAMESLLPNLEPDGAFIVSLWRYGHNSAIWRSLEKRFAVRDATVVTNNQGVTWDIKVLRPLYQPRWD